MKSRLYNIGSGQLGTLADIERTGTIGVAGQTTIETMGVNSGGPFPILVCNVGLTSGRRLYALTGNGSIDFSGSLLPSDLSLPNGAAGSPTNLDTYIINNATTSGGLWFSENPFDTPSWFGHFPPELTSPSSLLFFDSRLYCINMSPRQLYRVNTGDPILTELIGTFSSSLTHDIESSCVHNGVIYALTQDTTNTIYTINSVSHSTVPVTSVASLDFPTNFIPKAIFSQGGNFNVMFIGTATDNSIHNYRVSLENPKSLVLSSNPAGLSNPQGLTWHNDILYAVDSTNDTLWSITGSDFSTYTNIGSFPSGLASPLALASHNGILYCTDNRGDELWQIDSSNPALSTLVGILPSGITVPSGLTSHNGELYCLNNADRSLWILDLDDLQMGSTNRGTLLPTVSDIRGLASYEGHLHFVANNTQSLYRIIFDNAGNVASTRFKTHVSTLSRTEGLAASPTRIITFMDDSPVTVMEGATRTFNLITEGLNNRSVNWSITGSNANNVFAATSGTIVPASDAAQISISVLENATYTGTQTFTLTATSTIASESIEIQVTENDGLNINISQSNLTITEGEVGSVSYTTNYANPTNLNWEITGAGASTDFPITSGTVNATSGSIPISTRENTLYRGNRNYTFTLSSNMVSTSIPIEITEDDEERIEIEETSIRINEGGSADLTINTNFHEGNTTLNWQITGTDAGSVFNATQGQIFVVNNFSILTLFALDDSVYTGNRDFLVTVFNDNTSNSVTVTVIDDESPPITVSIDQPGIQVIEGNSFDVSVTTINYNSGSLLWRITGTNNATNFPITSGSFSVSNGTGVFTVATTENTVEESDREFTLEVYHATDTGATASLTITVEDDDATFSRESLIRATQIFDAEDELIELYDLKFSNNTYYFQGTHFGNIQFRDSNGVIRDYVPLPMKITGIEHSSDGSSNRPSLSIANSVFSTLSMQPEDFVGSRITRRQTLKKYLTTNPPVEFPVQKYTIDRVASSNITITEFELAAPFDLAGLTLPKRKVIGHFCPWEYQGIDRFDRGGCSWPSNNTSPAGVQVFIDAEDNEITGFTMYDSTATYSVDDLVQYTVGSFTTIYKAVVNNPLEAPSANSTEWIRVETCGKRLASCKARFQRFASKTNTIANVPLPFGAFPGSRKFR